MWRFRDSTDSGVKGERPSLGTGATLTSSDTEYWVNQPRQQVCGKLQSIQICSLVENSYFISKKLTDLFCSPPPELFMWPPVTNYMLLYSMLLCKKIARAPGVIKQMLTKLGRGGGRIDPSWLLTRIGTRFIKSIIRMDFVEWHVVEFPTRSRKGVFMGRARSLHGNFGRKSSTLIVELRTINRRSVN